MDRGYWRGVKASVVALSAAQEILLTSLSLNLHCVVRPNNLNMLTEDAIKNALKAIKYPGYSRDIVSFGLVDRKSVV